MTPPPVRGQLMLVVATLLAATTAATLVAHSGTSVAAGPSARAVASCAPAPDRAHVVRLTARLVSDRVAADGTLSVIVSTVGKSAETVTVVFPSARCAGSAGSDPAISAVASARRTFEQGCGPGRTSVTGLVGSMTIDAVAMGRAELDPVTAVKRLSCRPAVPAGADAAQGSGLR